MKSICVFAGSNIGARPEYRAAAEELGRALARRHVKVVFGGGQVGLMGVLADAVLAGHGHVTGVIPEAWSHARSRIQDCRISGSSPRCTSAKP